MGAFETMLKGMAKAKEQEDKGDFEWEGGSEFLATLRADLQTAYASGKAREQAQCSLGAQPGGGGASAAGGAAKPAAEKSAREDEDVVLVEDEEESPASPAASGVHRDAGGAGGARSRDGGKGKVTPKQQRIESAFKVTHVTHRSTSSLLSPSKNIAGVQAKLDVPPTKPHFKCFECYHCPRTFPLSCSRGKHMKSCPERPEAASAPVGGGVTEADLQLISDAMAREASRHEMKNGANVLEKLPVIKRWLAYLK